MWNQGWERHLCRSLPLLGCPDWTSPSASHSPTPASSWWPACFCPGRAAVRLLLRGHRRMAPPLGTMTARPGRHMAAPWQEDAGDSTEGPWLQVTGERRRRENSSVESRRRRWALPGPPAGGAGRRAWSWAERKQGRRGGSNPAQQCWRAATSAFCFFLCSRSHGLQGEKQNLRAALSLTQEKRPPRGSAPRSPPACRGTAKGPASPGRLFPEAPDVCPGAGWGVWAQSSTAWGERAWKFPERA